MTHRNLNARKLCLAVGLVLGAASTSLAQFADSPWPGFAGRADKQRSVTAPGPVEASGVTFTGVGAPSYGGITLGENGDLYFKEYWTNVNGDGTGSLSIVKRMDPDTGEILAETANLGGVGGDHGGVAVGVDALYVPVFRGAGNTSLYKLDKTTLAVINEFTNPGWMGLRGTPLIGNVDNMNGNVNIYVVDRDGNQILAIDSVTGTQMGSYSFGGHVLGQLGPMWTSEGRDTFAYFNNSDLGNAVALRDDGAGTLTNIWGPLAGPGNFNWWGSGALSDDGTRIYVTTFNDNDTPSLWALSVADGTAIWSIAGNRGDPNEFNFFGRPVVMGNNIYCGGAFAVIAKFTDNGSSATNDWVRWGPGGGTDPASGPEMTTTSGVETPGGERFIYSIAQDEGGLGRLDVLRDDGATFTELFRTNLDNTMRWSTFSSSSGTIDAAGNLWVGGGRNGDAQRGDIYRFSVGGGPKGCPCDFNADDNLNSQDFFDFLVPFFKNDLSADYNEDGVINSQDFFDFLTCFFEPPAECL